jgi:anti-sigma factor RsiW
MSRPQESEFHQFIDGRLSPERAAEVQGWLDGHAEDAAAVEAWQSQKEMLRRSYHRFGTVPGPERTAASRRMRSFGILAQLVVPVICLAIGLIAGYFLRGGPAVSAATAMAALPRQAVVAHAVYSPEVRHPVEVGVNQTAHLAQWLSKRLGGAIAIPDLSSSGFQLLGGRLLPDESGPAAQFMYEDKNGLRLTLYVKRNPGHDATAFRFASVGGLSVFYWADEGFGYALSGELERSGLLSVANIVHRQLSGR